MVLGLHNGGYGGGNDHVGCGVLGLRCPAYRATRINLLV